jgi:DNA-binding CsgD family transcriptional regulator
MLNFTEPTRRPSIEALNSLARLPHTRTPEALRMPGVGKTGLLPASLDTAMTLWLSAMLDEVDYPMLLVNGDSLLLHANQVARAEMDDSHPLQLLGDELRVLHPKDVVPLREALQAAQQRGLRRLLTLGEDKPAVTVAVVPMPALAGSAQRAVLLVLGKRQVCERLSAQWFAREHNLTPAETQVLDALCSGLGPQQVAAQQGVAISTVRSQIGSIRAKTGAQSIRELVRQVAVLPPLLNALRGLGAGPTALN